MHYLIDGYNLLFHLHEEVGGVEQARLSLLEVLSDLFSSLKIKGSIVFDNRHAHALDVPSHTMENALLIIFTPKGLTADEYILELIDGKKRPALETIVTSDRSLLSAAKEKGAKGQTIEEFSSWLKRKKKFEVRKTSREKPVRETKAHIDHLLKIFEERLSE